MKCLKLGFLFHQSQSRYFKYPDNINSLDEFADFANEHFNSFVKLVCLDDDNSVAPYFVKGEECEEYINISKIRSISETDCTFLTREEYDKRLEKIIAEKCVSCESYVECNDGDNLEGHRNSISLDGVCICYTKKKD